MGHVVQLFDTVDSRAETLASFVRTGLLQDEKVLVVSTREHWNPARERLEASGLDVAAAALDGKLIYLDADTLIVEVCDDAGLDRGRFEDTIGQRVRQLTADGSRLRVYGELVDCLAGAGRHHVADSMEGEWNRLRADVPFSLLCAYGSHHFSGEDSVDALRAICRSHSEALAHPRDKRSLFLLPIGCS
jgi:hypothetical protein